MSLQAIATKIESVFLTAAPVAQAVQSVAGIATPPGAIAGLVLALPGMIDAAETLASGVSGVSGPQKLQAVKAAVIAGLNEVNPNLGAVADHLWALVGPVVSMLVALSKIGIKVS